MSADSHIKLFMVNIAVFVLTVISIAQLVPVSGQLNCTQWRKLNAYDNPNLGVNW